MNFREFGMSIIPNVTEYPVNKIPFDEWLLIQKYCNIFTIRFDYDNLPEQTKNIVYSNRIIERMMFFTPALAWFEDKVLGLQCLPVSGQWNFNIVGYPTEWQVFGFNGYRKDCTDKNSVIMPNDPSFSIPFLHTHYNCQFLIELDRTHRQNIKRKRQPLILEIDEDEKKSADKFKRELDNFSDDIKVRVRGTESAKDKRAIVNPRPFNSFAYDSNVEFIGDKLSTDYDVFENRIFQYYGYNNRNIEKKERLLVDEINAGNQVVNAYYETAYEARAQAIERVNKMFGVNIKITKKVEEFENAIKEFQSNVQQPNPLEKGD